MSTSNLEGPSAPDRVGSAAWTPDRETLAARSLARVDRIRNDDERREAFREHLRAFPPLFALV